MNVDLMRAVDRRLGVPLCAILTAFDSLKSIFKKPERVTKPSKILFIQLSEMGSMVLAYSLFQKTKELFPEAKLYFLTFRENRYAIDLLEVIPHKSVLTISSSGFGKFTLSTLKVLWDLRREKIGLAVDMEFFARFTAILSYLSGAKNRAGFYRFHQEGLYRGNLLTHRVALNPHIHIAYNFLNLAYSLLSPEEDVPVPKNPIREKDIIFPTWKASPAAQEAVLNKLKSENPGVAGAKKIIILNPNASDIIPLRRWPLQSYIELARRLLEHQGVFIVITGLEAEREEAGKICDALRQERCINLAGNTSFSELIDLYSVSDALITNDSGPAHFSALTGIKTFIFFGPETPRLYGPLSSNSHVFYSGYSCSPCVSASNHRRSPCNDNRCLRAISVEEVCQAVRKGLGI